jgi:hypothetical protein
LAAAAHGMPKVPILRALLRFVRFGLPCDFRTTITIARGGGALWRTLRHFLSSPMTRLRQGTAGACGPGTPKLQRRRQAGAPSIEKPRRTGRRRAMALQIGKTAHGRRATTKPQPSPAPRQRSAAARSRHDQISNVWKGNAGNTPASENEGVGEHVRTRFHVDPKAACEIAEPENRHRTERRKLVSSAGPRKERSDR